jgi:hypothetical protein
MVFWMPELLLRKLTRQDDDTDRAAQYQKVPGSLDTLPTIFAPEKESRSDSRLRFTFSHLNSSRKAHFDSDRAKLQFQ